MDCLLPEKSRHSGESRNPVPSSDMNYNNRINLETAVEQDKLPAITNLARV
jgi:hypothetical protein